MVELEKGTLNAIKILVWFGVIVGILTIFGTIAVLIIANIFEPEEKLPMFAITRKIKDHEVNIGDLTEQGIIRTSGDTLICSEKEVMRDLIKSMNRGEGEILLKYIEDHRCQLLASGTELKVSYPLDLGGDTLGVEYKNMKSWVLNRKTE